MDKETRILVWIFAGGFLVWLAWVYFSAAGTWWGGTLMSLAVVASAIGAAYLPGWRFTCLWGFVAANAYFFLALSHRWLGIALLSAAAAALFLVVRFSSLGRWFRPLLPIWQRFAHAAGVASEGLGMTIFAGAWAAFFLFGGIHLYPDEPLIALLALAWGSVIAVFVCVALFRAAKVTMTDLRVSSSLHHGYSARIAVTGVLGSWRKRNVFAGTFALVSTRPSSFALFNPPRLGWGSVFLFMEPSERERLQMTLSDLRRLGVIVAAVGLSPEARTDLQGRLQVGPERQIWLALAVPARAVAAVKEIPGIQQLIEADSRSWTEKTGAQSEE